MPQDIENKSDPNCYLNYDNFIFNETISDDSHCLGIFNIDEFLNFKDENNIDDLN
jgi:hypothetical protein